mgnify:CR=1 FL=1
MNEIEKHQVEGIKQRINEINSQSEDELAELYKTKLRQSVLEDSNEAGIGLIEIRRLISKPIEFSFVEEDRKVMFSITATL